MCLNHRVVPTAPPQIFGDKFPLQVFRNYYLYEVAFFFQEKKVFRFPRSMFVSPSCTPKENSPLQVALQGNCLLVSTSGVEWNKG